MSEYVSHGKSSPYLPLNLAKFKPPQIDRLKLLRAINDFCFLLNRQVLLLILPMSTLALHNRYIWTVFHVRTVKLKEKKEVEAFFFSQLFTKEFCSPQYADYSYRRCYYAQCSKWKFWYYACSSDYDVVFAVCIGEGHDCID